MPVKNGGFCRRKVLLPACICWGQLVQLDYGGMLEFSWMVLILAVTISAFVKWTEMLPYWAVTLTRSEAVNLQITIFILCCHIYDRYDICGICQNGCGKFADQIFTTYEASNAPTTTEKLWVSVLSQFVEVLLYLLKNLCWSFLHLLIESVAIVHLSCLL